MLVCPVCAQKDWRTIYHIDPWDIKECASCKFARIDPMPKRDSRPGFYSETQNLARKKKKRSFFGYLSREFKKLFKAVSGRDKYLIFYKKLNKYLKARDSILDIACVDGAFIGCAKKRYKMTGIEISGDLVELARRDHPEAEIVEGDFLTANLQDKKFDGMTMISLLEHLDDPEQALRNAYDLLEKGGVLFLKTVNYSAWTREIMRQKWTGFRPPDHMVYFSPSNLKKLMQRIGFSKIHTTAWPLSDNMYCDAWK